MKEFEKKTLDEKIDTILEENDESIISSREKLIIKFLILIPSIALIIIILNYGFNFDSFFASLFFFLSLISMGVILYSKMFKFFQK